MTPGTKPLDQGWRYLFIAAGAYLFVAALAGSYAFHSALALISVLGASIGTGWYVDRSHGAFLALGAGFAVFLVLTVLCIALDIPLPATGN